MTMDDVHSIRDVFDVRIRSRRQPIDDALEAIATVHQVGGLPRIPIVDRTLNDAQAAYQIQVNRARPIAIGYDPFGSGLVFALVHEIGHFRLVDDLCREHGTTEEEARRVISELQRRLLLDIVFVDDDELDDPDADLASIGHFPTEAELDALSNER